MFDLRLKRAEAALSEGRLDEAFDVLKASDLKEHRSGQKLIGRLSKAFVQRGQDHLAHQQLAPAMDDCNRAEKLAGNLPEVAALRSMLCEAIEAARIESVHRSEQLAKAKHQMDQGWLSAGRKILVQTPDNQQAQVLLKNADLIETETDAAARRIEKALKHDQLDLALRIYANSALADSLSDQAVLTQTQLQDKAAGKIRQHLQEGNLNRAAALSHQLCPAIASSDQIAPLRQAIDYCFAAVSCIESAHFSDACMYLKKVQTLIPKAQWVKQAIQQNQTAQAACENLQSGPLGIVEAVAQNPLQSPKTTNPQKKTLPSRRFKEQSAIMKMPEHNQITRFLLQLDGIGAYYVYCADRVTIGPVSGSRRSDIEVVAAPDVGVQQIQRFEEDYFLSDLLESKAAAPAQQLLTEGARLELSPRCRFKFTVPNPASGTACLIPSSARFPRADVNAAILMKREILIGPGRNCHIQTGQLTETLTLYLQDGQIRCQGVQGALSMNESIEIGPLRMMLTTR